MADHIRASCSPPNRTLGLQLSMTLWTGLKQQHSASDNTIGPTEEDQQAKLIESDLETLYKISFLH